ncbi:MAG: Archaeal/vacuolar-type H+-ATPase subunit E/Vma4 [Candidatus Alkanophagales archaeon MCA70_species_1]|nr:Archaeal/vacuolar-type H+-ATPase subunit E/Vma4 [Candidatus Alkanophaga volatiphilum]
MGAAEIVNRIREEGEKERERILNEAKERAKKIIEDAKAEAERSKKRAMEEEERRAETEKRRIIQTARLEARRKKWMAQEEMIKEVMNKAVEKIKEVKEKGFGEYKYDEILRNLIKVSAMSAGGGDLEVILSEEDARFISKKDLDEISKDLGASLTLSEERVKSIGGVIVRTKDGRIAVNNTFEKRLERLSDAIRDKVAAIMFKGGA